MQCTGTSELQPSLDRARSASTNCLRPDTSLHSPERERYKPNTCTFLVICAGDLGQFWFPSSSTFSQVRVLLWYLWTFLLPCSCVSCELCLGLCNRFWLLPLFHSKLLSLLTEVLSMLIMALQCWLFGRGWSLISIIICSRSALSVSCLSCGRNSSAVAELSRFKPELRLAQCWIFARQPQLVASLTSPCCSCFGKCKAHLCTECFSLCDLTSRLILRLQKTPLQFLKKHCCVT